MLYTNGNKGINKYQYDFLPLFMRVTTLIWGFLPSGKINYSVFGSLQKNSIVSWNKQMTTLRINMKWFITIP